jgi:hypothetical protein
MTFLEELKKTGAKTYLVGGCVRDKLMGKTPKDIDLLVTGVEYNLLVDVLSKYGKVDLFGESFGIIKFKNTTEEFEITLPRRERKISQGHKGFEVSVDINMSVEEELGRRDFTMNAMAMDADGNIIDPYGGKRDIKAKLIRAVNPKTFKEDPLRMLRAVQFAVRFGFEVEGDTHVMICCEPYGIKQISPERILIEFEKIVKAGPDACHEAQYQLYDMRLLGLIMGAFKGGTACLKEKQTIRPENMGEFIYMLCHGTRIVASEHYKNMLKGDIETQKYIQALEIACVPTVGVSEARMRLHDAIKRSAAILGSNNLLGHVKTAQNEFNRGLYPKTLKELAINGDDLLKMGFSGVKVGEILKGVLVEIYNDDLKNNSDEIVVFINENYKGKQA